MEDQIDLFYIPGVPFNPNNRIYLRAGRIYVTNGNSFKVMEFTSYGDLVFLLQNAELNPKPVVLEALEGNAELTNRMARSYPFNSVGFLVVDSEKNFYVEDAVPPDNREIDGTYEILLYKRIIKFDRQGNFVHYLGQEGTGGTPFPYIDRIFVTADDELVVVTRMFTSWVVFWYNSEGRLLYRVQIEQENLPKNRNDFSAIIRIFPDFNNRDLLIHIDYFEEEIIASTGTRNAIRNHLSRIYRYNLEEEEYADYFDLPEKGTLRQVIGAAEQEVAAPSFELLGVGETGHFFFLRPAETGLYELMILTEQGKVEARRYLKVEDSELYYKTFNVSEDGVVAAMFCFDDEVRVVWWRSDRLLMEKGT